MSADKKNGSEVVEARLKTVKKSKVLTDAYRREM